MTLSARARGEDLSVTPRDKIISALRRYAELYGDDFTAAAFSPSTAKWRDNSDELIRRSHAGDPQTGSWPSLNSIKKPFGGSFDAARAAAGLAPNRPGPKRAAGRHRPVRGVSHPARLVYVERDSAVVARERDAALQRAERAEARAERLKVLKTPKVPKAADDGALAAARAKATEARASATRAAARAERAEATIATLREERRALRGDIARLQRIADAARDRVREVQVPVEVPVDRIVEVPVERVVHKVVTKTLPAPEQAVVDDARARARAAVASKRRAIQRADSAEAAYAELAGAVRGSTRRLTAAELDELRAKGPAGPAMLGEALRQLAGARRSGTATRLRAALTQVATAALTWRDRL